MPEPANHHKQRVHAYKNDVHLNKKHEPLCGVNVHKVVLKSI